GKVRMEELADQFRRSRELVEFAHTRDLRRGLMIPLIILIVTIWVFALISLVYLAHRISAPIQQLTGGLSQLASGDLRVATRDAGHHAAARASHDFQHL